MTEIHPRTAIRRFDVFAEYQRQEARADGIPADEAAGYGLWVAKVVASRRYGRTVFKGTPSQVREQAAQQETGAAGSPQPKWHTLEGQPQTDALFEEQIVRRMGVEFYTAVFVPAIEAAWQAGKSYPGIRDSIRRTWTPAPPPQSSSGAGSGVSLLISSCTGCNFDLHWFAVLGSTGSLLNEYQPGRGFPAVIFGRNEVCGTAV